MMTFKYYRDMYVVYRDGTYAWEIDGNEDNHEWLLSKGYKEV